MFTLDHTTSDIVVAMSLNYRYVHIRFLVSDPVGGLGPDLLKCSYSVEFLIPEILVDNFEHLNRDKLGTT